MLNNGQCCYTCISDALINNNCYASTNYLKLGLAADVIMMLCDLMHSPHCKSMHVQHDIMNMQLLFSEPS